ncbi:DUF262 domain-containing protein [Caulobacter sp.]|uniref:DUF262 domain-containing protein n=1 Tax=Caulobacter sp. TaxID=78 RepID=UPI003BA911DC
MEQPAETVGFEEEAEDLAVPPAVSADATDRAIERHFETGRLRVVQEKSELYLPHVVDFIVKDRWGNLRPEYQRRLRWDDAKKSKLIESFIMNVPVPPVFLYEVNIGSFEVMDGQQRLNAIVDFLQGKFSLTGLKIWPGLNDRTFSQLPPIVRRGLERAKISAITLMSDSNGTGVNDMDLRAQVFERLNTGGEQLNPQELRNSLYSGPFNKLVVNLATDVRFTDAWGIPSHEEHTLSDLTPDNALRTNTLFKRMLDVEIVLRFFAFRKDEGIIGGVRGMLDNTMKSLRNSGPEEIVNLRSEFENALDLTLEVFGAQAFRLPPVGAKPQGLLSRPLYDAQMVAMHRLMPRRAEIVESAAAISSAVTQLAHPDSPNYDLMVGRGNTAATIRDRIALVARTIVGNI